MRAHEPKANPYHVGALIPPGNRLPALFRQPALCGHPQHCAGAVRQGRCQLRDIVPPTLVRPPRAHPSWEDGGTLERGTDAYPALAQDDAVTSGQWGMSLPSPLPLCGHPGRCATIPDIVGSWDGGTAPHLPLCDFQPSVIMTLEPMYGRQPNKRLPHTTLEAALGQAQDSSRRPARGKPGGPSTPWCCTSYRHT
jgi:hypothetical protein